MGLSICAAHGFSYIYNCQIQNQTFSNQAGDKGLF